MAKMKYYDGTKWIKINNAENKNVEIIENNNVQSNGNTIKFGYSKDNSKKINIFFKRLK